MLLAIRWILELIVMVSFVAGSLKLRADWHTIEPPVWRWIILAYQGIVAANALALLWAITENRPITWATWLIVSSYIGLVLPLIFQKFIPVPTYDRRASDKNGPVLR